MSIFSPTENWYFKPSLILTTKHAAAWSIFLFLKYMLKGKGALQVHLQ